MRLAEFILANREAILEEWTAFARTNQPADRNLSEQALRDHASQILTEIVVDMGRPKEDDARQGAKDPVVPEARGSEGPARAHAKQRARNGFEISQMVAEYRALRATILRLWVASHTTFSSHDVEDLTRFNEAVDEALAESLKFFLVEVDHARDLFLGVLGHDLRGPLSIIASCAQLEARSRPDGDPKSRATITLRSVAHMKALLDDLVEYARNRLGAKVAIQPDTVDLDKFTRETIEEILAIHPERVIDLDIRGNLQGHWDVHRLHQVVANLIFNALKYGEAEKPIAITLDGTAADEVVLAVHSIGATISPGVLPTIFEPLVRDVDDVAWQASGANMGLGLYAAHEIVTAHSGVISVTSTDEDGTRFEVRLPRINSQA
ncbi:sensor histidine kinase [Variovorax sp. J22G21]|uniref:sensor histidine kinase n=1 Tax=Variovorax fucosicus TaxID=3053517 RepID=UPI0025770887|nr:MULTISPECIES: sensor histidine kinase [unclassified Variovorax]MDM0039887.1 sensor histidine kinase [Variovorax sp. J22R193]MDM0064564.1 sensor histidine kinase [Variovorax sp. J22G21]